MEQLNIFDFINKEYEDYKITKPIRLIELFAGIGSQAKALERLGANFEHYRVVEFDKYAIKSYNAVHGTNFETSDITKISADYLGIEDTKNYEYIVTYSFPCQDLSMAGKGKGMEKGSGTRSGLLWEVERLLNECNELPQVLLMENVPQVHSKKNIEHFNQWIAALEQLGYSNFYEDLNAKNYGIPQNRNRTFMVSILGYQTYKFPKPFELKLKLKDMLEEDADEKYYLTEKGLTYILGNAVNKSLKDMYKRADAFFNKTIAYCLNTKVDRRIGDSNYINEEYDEEIQVKTFLKIKNATKKGYLEAYEGDGVDISRRMQYHRGTVQRGIIQTLDTQPTKGVVVSVEKTKIRKLTPKECWRLMGFDDEDFNKASHVNSDTQLYKQAGNSIVVNVLEEIFKQLL